MSDWQLLARGDGVNVSRCPEGHIHLEMGEGLVTLRLDEQRFLSLAHTLLQALANVSSSDLIRPFQAMRANRASRN